MVHLDHQIVAVAMQEVAGQPRALAHPVDPDAAPVRTAVNMIFTDEDIHRSMQLDASGFTPTVFVVLPNIVDFIPGDC
jgi:hypothetical protein